MAHFLLVAHHDAQSPFNLTQDKQPVWDALDALDADMTAAGVIVFSRGVANPEDSSTLRFNAAGELERSAGPFQELEHWFSGFWLIDCASRADAEAWGARAAAAHRCDIEVRPLRPPPGEE